MNGYIVIVGLFIVAGIGITAWGVRIIMAARKTQIWPSVDGDIVHSIEGSETEDLLPEIEFSYRVGSESFRQIMAFPSGTMPTPEFSQSYLKKYPVGCSVKVYYNPEQHDIATLEPGMANGDWMVLVAGITTVFIGLGMVFVDV